MKLPKMQDKFALFPGGKIPVKAAENCQFHWFCQKLLIFQQTRKLVFIEETAVAQKNLCGKNIGLSVPY
ncbi:hypothetical protein [Aestuariispira insulae]|uniref:hypothetical protein n=1 Tax=Aestuariispira insulae TaxID=1461337 RepID=UPI0011C068EF|nr:hypothetical protein [Aestuariispira insulae]